MLPSSTGAAVADEHGAPLPPSALIGFVGELRRRAATEASAAVAGSDGAGERAPLLLLLDPSLGQLPWER